MKSFINFIKGFDMTRRTTKMVLFLYIINLLFSMSLAVPLYHSLRNHIGNSDAGDTLEKGFDYLWWEEYRDQSKGLEKTFTPSIMGKGALLENLESLIQMKFFTYPSPLILFGLLYMLFHTFLSGGIVYTFFKKPLEFSFAKFFKGAGKFSPSFFGIMAVSVGMFLLVMVSLARWFSSIVSACAKNSVSEITPFFLGLVFSLLTWVVLLFFHMILDYARIKTVSEDKKNIIKAIASSIMFVFKNPGTTLGLYYLIFSVNILLSIIYIILLNLIPQISLWGITGAFIIQQSFIFALIWTRCWLYSSQLKLLRYLQ
jgi:hypothetical protein